jgi:hypothetical protein
MLIWIAIGLAIIFGIVKPYADGILDTSLWLAKITMPEGVEEMSNAKQLLKIRQAALVDGWPSNIPFVNTIIFVAAIALGFVAHWWAGIVVIGVIGFVGGLCGKLINKPVIWYITLLSQRLANRMADYAKTNDNERELACREMQEDIIPVMVLYGTTDCKVPTTKQIAANPYSDINYFLELNSPIAPLTDGDYYEIHQKIVKATFDYGKAHPNERMTRKKMEQIKNQVFREEAQRRSK